MNLFQIIPYPVLVGTLAGIATSVSMLPQLYKTIKTKKSDEISVSMLLLLSAGIAGWIYYGIIKKDLPIIITNCFSLVVNVLVLVMHFKYKKEGSPQPSG